jgi:hypothetical protein
LAQCPKRTRIFYFLHGGREISQGKIIKHKNNNQYSLPVEQKPYLKSHRPHFVFFNHFILVPSTYVLGSHLIIYFLSNLLIPISSASHFSSNKISSQSKLLAGALVKKSSPPLSNSSEKGTKRKLEDEDDQESGAKKTERYSSDGKIILFSCVAGFTSDCPNGHPYYNILLQHGHPFGYQPHSTM